MIQLLREFGSGFGSSRKIDSLARQIAELSADGVRKQIEGHTTSMTSAEARGFVRARASRIVRCQARLLLTHHEKVRPDWSPRIVRRAIEQVVPLVLKPYATSSQSRRAA